MEFNRVIKPLGQKSYGTIPHLPGSRQGRDDVGCSPGQHRICCVKPRDKHDTIIVLEKLDGSNVAVANIDGQLVPLIRAGYPAVSSKWEQHRLFAAWVSENLARFEFLKAGERVAGEWLAQAHGTLYAIGGPSDRLAYPLVAFDILRNGHERAPYAELVERAGPTLQLPAMLGQGCQTIEVIDKGLGELGHHGATTRVEGAIWRVERKEVVDFLAKYVRPDKVDGAYLPELTGQPPVWNWRPR